MVDVRAVHPVQEMHVGLAARHEQRNARIVSIGIGLLRPFVRNFILIFHIALFIKDLLTELGRVKKFSIQRPTMLQ